MNEARRYEQALARAGLGDRLEFHGVRVDQTIAADLVACGRGTGRCRVSIIRRFVM